MQPTTVGFSVDASKKHSECRPNILHHPAVKDSIEVGYVRKDLSAPVTTLEERLSEILKEEVSRSTLAAAVRRELHLGNAVRSARVAMNAVVTDLLLRKAVVRNIPPAARIVSGLFPALIFEALSRGRTSVTGDHGGSEFPSPALGDAVISVSKRLVPWVHDLLRVPKEQLAPECAKIASDIVLAVRKRLEEPCASAADADAAVEVQAHEKGDTVTYRCGAVQHTILAGHMRKLRSLFRGPPEEFDGRVFVLLQRYYNLTGCVDDPSAEAGWHGAVPENVMDHLMTAGHVCSEVFASPFNTSCRIYCSAFRDTDCYFGSLGSMFDNFFLQGTFEANPPFEHATVLHMAHHFVRCLERSDKPLAFLVVLPWSDKGKPLASVADFAKVVEQYVTGFVDLDAQSTPFVDGHQQCLESAGFTSRLCTRLTALQNAPHAAATNGARLVASAAAVWQELGVRAKRSRESPTVA